ncbi:toll-like receptor 13 [Vespa velutina]|uniref:toll-like receptor 13 n=1 Tax=Vespa velutina TaxID=202808 RepID=UPI001FB1D186|nr:toll-like receptor 13 [Vespa velutina]XP_047369105.1 toll-like receptor 13 [Vespa velutina]
MRFFILILPLVTAIPLKSFDKKYDLGIEDGKLKYVKLIEPSDTVDLSNLELNELDRYAFEYVTDVKTLNLAGNSLKNLPHFVFSNLTRLENLSLARNKIVNVENLFVGLKNLNQLDISYNPISHLRRGYLFGLTKSVEILTEGNIFWSINTNVFTNLFLKEDDEKENQLKINDNEKERLTEASDRKVREIELEQENVIFRRYQRDINGQLGENPRAKLCMTDDGVVTSISHIDKNETLEGECREVTFDHNKGQLELRSMGIKSFQEDWYKIRSFPVSSIDLSDNDITEITKEVLNDLPMSVEYVNLAANRISHLWKNVIENRYLKRLNFKANSIDTIEDNSFNKTNLEGLFLADNQLDNLNFLHTLPSTLTQLILTSNQIVSINRGDFSNLKRLTYLNMGNNKITKLQNNAFEGQENLPVLILTRNRIAEIEPRAFSDLKMLTTLYLYQNLISKLDKNTFTDLTKLQDLNLITNKFTIISEDTFPLLPKSLMSLNLDGNEIKSLEKGSFVDTPRYSLSLNENQISNIAQGAFKLPNLRNLYLNNNTLTTIDGDSYQGLPQLRHLSLSGNQISSIEKGSCKNLAGLQILDISGNPFQHLKNGALYGLNIEKGTFLYIYDNQLKSMYGGMFEDA